MTKLSLVPEISTFKGINFINLLKHFKDGGRISKKIILYLFILLTLVNPINEIS